MNKAIKYSLIGFVGLIILLLVVIPFIPADSYRAPIEEQLSTALKLDVSIGDISLTSLPSPGVKAKQIKVSDDGTEVALLNSIHITPKLSSLFSDQIQIRNVHISGLDISADDISRFTQTSSTDSTAKTSIHIANISGDDNRISLGKDQVFGPFSFKVNLDEGPTLKTLNLTLDDQNFELDVDQANKQYNIELHASDWTPPVKPAITLTSLQINGEQSKDRLLLKTIKATLYEGQLQGNLLVTQGTPVKLDSRLNLTTLNMGLLLKAMGNHSVDGTASAETTIRSEAASMGELANNYRIESKVRIEKGHIYEADLEQAARSLSAEWKAGGQTPFDEVKTNAVIQPNTVTLKNLSITSSLLAATGDMKIKNNVDLDGEISVGLNDATGLITMPLMISGTIEQPKVRPTNEALAGGAIGTAILGPGVGTAVGVKAGEIVGKIGNLFGSDDDEKEPPKKD